MPLTITETNRTVIGNRRLWSGTVAFDTSYPTNGEPFVPADIGFAFFDLVLIEPRAGLTFEYNRTNAAIRALRATAIGGMTFTNTHTAHTHVLHFQTAAAANAVTAATNALRTAAAAFDVAGVVDSAGEGGSVNTAVATHTAPANAAATAYTTANFEVTDTTDLSAITGVRVVCIGI